jgi:4-amino-4-deoxy-L-arabinose transferase-like glycosyltransferase
MPTPAVKAKLAGLGVGVATAILMLATEPFMAIGWDEGYTLGREARLREWFRALGNPAAFAAGWQPLPWDEELVQLKASRPPQRGQLASRSNFLFDRDVVAWFWPFAREEPHGHPPFYALIGLLGDFLTPFRPDLERARLGPILLFAFTAGVVYAFMAGRWGPWAGALSAAAWVFQPNMFGHGHYAAYDAVLTCLWVLSVVCFSSATGRDEPSSRIAWWLRVATFGLLLGCAAATKFTGWFLPVPFAVWSTIYRSRRGFLTLLFGLAVAAIVLFVQMPPWWTDPIGGVTRFLSSNLGRGKTQPIPVLFLGTVYNTPNESLPWYNTLVWTLFVTPVGILLLAVMGLGATLRNWRNDRVGILVAGHWAFVMLLRAMPRVPGHDGVRLFLPAFGLLALLAGRGGRALIDVGGRWGKAAIVAVTVEAIVSVAVTMPVPLSYFSPLVGGLPGATSLGMEATYYWDAINPEARAWLRENTRPGETIAFHGFPTSFLYLRRVGELPRRLVLVDFGAPRWIVIQNRPGNFESHHHRLITHGKPAYRVTKLGVPLIWIFPYSELERTGGADQL